MPAAPRPPPPSATPLRAAHPATAAAGVPDLRGVQTGAAVVFHPDTIDVRTRVRSDTTAAIAHSAAAV